MDLCRRGSRGLGGSAGKSQRSPSDGNVPAEVFALTSWDVAGLVEREHPKAASQVIDRDVSGPVWPGGASTMVNATSGAAPACSVVFPRWDLGNATLTVEPGSFVVFPTLGPLVLGPGFPRRRT